MNARQKSSRVLAQDGKIRSESFAQYLLPAPRASQNLLVADTTQPPTEAGALVICDQHYARGDDTGQNRHEDFFALYLVQSGRGVHVINGHAYGVARGDVYITPPGTAHAYRDFDELRAVAFCFQAAFFHEEELEALRALPGFWAFLTATESSEYSHDEFRDYRLHLSPELHAVAQKQIEDIKAESAPLHQAALRAVRHESSLRENVSGKNARREKGAANFYGAVENGVVAENADDGNAARRILVRPLFFKLLVQLARWRDAAHRESPPRHESAPERENATREYSRVAPDREMAALLQFCEENFDQPLTVPQLAARVFLSTARFSEVFARHTGCPPAAYLRRLRLSRAQTLLRETSLPVGEIAARCGYGEAAQLSRAFRSAFQQSPSQYRAANRREK